MPYNVGGVVEPVGFTVAVDDWARSMERIAGVLNEEPAVRDFTADGRKRARYFGSHGAVAYFDFVEAEHDVAAGDSALVLLTEDVAARVDALAALGIDARRNEESGDYHVAASDCNGVGVVFTTTRPRPLGADRARALTPLPYVFDLGVDDLDQAAPIWAAITGLPGVRTPRSTDSGGQIDMHHFLVDGATHAIGLTSLRADRGFTKRDSGGHGLEYVMRTHGEGMAGVGFLYKGLADLDEHIDRLSKRGRRSLLFEAPRSYLMGENNITHPDTTGGIAIIIAMHYEGWAGDLNDLSD